MYGLQMCVSFYAQKNSHNIFVKSSFLILGNIWAVSRGDRYARGLKHCTEGRSSVFNGRK